MTIKLKPKLKRKIKKLGRKRLKKIDKVSKGIVNVRPVRTI